MTCLFAHCHVSAVSICLFFLIFFFKQKTAYEMRISDWSSDVCSSDLPRRAHQQSRPRGAPGGAEPPRRLARRRDRRQPRPRTARGNGRDRRADRPRRHALWRRLERLSRAQANRTGGDRSRTRSEEHTSELQSLMRISYAVFCLKQKKNN